MEMNIKIPGYKDLVVPVPDSTTSTYVITESLKYVGLDVSFAQYFSLFFPNKCFYLDVNEIISAVQLRQKEIPLLLFRHFFFIPQVQKLCGIMKSCPAQIQSDIDDNLLYIVFSYCYYCYKCSLWPVTEQMVIQTTTLLRIYSETYQENYLLENQSREQLPKQIKLLLPERNSCFSTLYADRFEKYFVIASKISYEVSSLLQSIVILISATSYFALSHYPINDIDYDWTSIMSISFDGIVLLDAEIGIAYLYLPFAMVEIIQQDEATLLFKTKTKIKLTRANSEANLQYLPKIGNIQTDNILVQQPVMSPNTASLKKLLSNSFANLTKNLDIPIKPRLENQENLPLEENQSVQFRIAASEKYMLKQSQTFHHDNYGNDVELFETNDTDLRKYIKVQFMNKKAADNFIQLFSLYAEQFDFQNLASNRFMKSMSLSQVELLKAVYMNNCMKYSVKPCQSVLERIDRVIDAKFLENRQEIFSAIDMSYEKIHHLHIRSLLQAISTVLNFRPQNSCLRLDFEPSGEINSTILVRQNNMVVLNPSKTGKSIYFQRGSGSPYEPFIPVRLDMYSDLIVKTIRFSNNDFFNLVYIYEISDFLQCLAIQQTLEEIEISNNLFMNKALIILANRMKGLKSLKTVKFENNDINSNGISCCLYLWDFNKIYLKYLSLRGAKMNHKASFKQLGQYIGRCVINYDRFQKLNLVGHKIIYQHAQEFYSGYDQELRNHQINGITDKRIDCIQLFGVQPDALDLFVLLAIDVIIGE